MKSGMGRLLGRLGRWQASWERTVQHVFDDGVYEGDWVDGQVHGHSGIQPAGLKPRIYEELTDGVLLARRALRSPYESLFALLGDGITPHDGRSGQEEQRREGGEQKAHAEQLIRTVDRFWRRVESKHGKPYSAMAPPMVPVAF